MKALIVGLGSIGLRHARLFLEKPGMDVVAFRQKGKGNALRLDEVYSWKEAMDLRPDIGIVANPTSEHITSALKLVEMGAHVFMEKPLSDGMQDVEKLAKSCRLAKRTCYVAYPLRFHPVIREARSLLKGRRALHARITCSSYLPDWRSKPYTRSSYSAHHALGGGAILDLSHEFDYAQYLFGDVVSIAGIKGRLSTVTVDAEDFADAILHCRSGTIVNVHLSCMSRYQERCFHVDFRSGYLRGDLARNTLELSWCGRKDTWSFKTDMDQVFRAQRDYFLGHLNKGKPMNGIAEAKDLLRKIVEFRNAQ